MPTNFPTSLDNGTSLPVVAGGDTVLSSTENTQSGAIEAIEAKVGIGASTPATGKVLAGTGTGTSAWTTGSSLFDAAGAAAAAEAASQPLDSDLTAIAALATTAFGRSLLTFANAAAARTGIGLGTAAVHADTEYETAGATWARASQGGGSAGTKLWVGTTEPSSPSDGDVWVKG